MHIILIQTLGDSITKFEYVNSKFERELGEKMTIEGIKMRVGIIADSRNEAIEAANVLIKKQNKLIRKQNKIESNKFWDSIILNDPLINDCIQTINNNR